MESVTNTFREIVIQFCNWVESDHHDLMDGRAYLIQLMSSIPPIDDLRYAGDSEAEYPYREHDGWQIDYARFSDFPFQYYRDVFNPLDIDSEEDPVMGDLSDDFADIYGDLWHGLQAANKGDDDEALSLWIDSYFYHWGKHASSALNAIDEYYRENYYTIKETESGRREILTPAPHTTGHTDP